MVFDFTSAVSFRACGTKIFRRDELHVTRRYANNVLILMSDGVLRFREDGQDIELRAGEYYIQRAGLLQEGKRLSDAPVYFYIEFQGAEYTEDKDGLPLRGTFSPSAVSLYPQRLEEAYYTHRATPFLLNGYMNLIFSELFANLSQNDAREHTAELIRNDIRARYTEGITLDDLSRRFGYDVDHIIRLFRRRYGTTPHRYLTDLRIEHACWLLANTDLSAKSIAYSVGYGDFPSFWRAFKSICGISPGQYRAKNTRDISSDNKA